MRLLMCAVVFAGALCAQSVPVERFDVSGLPSSPQTDTERELQRMIAGHRAGDTAHAAEIQRKLAAYYRAKGDQSRARSAESLANGVRVPARPADSNMDMPGFGNPTRQPRTGTRDYDTMPMPMPPYSPYGMPVPRQQQREKEKPPMAAPVPGEAPKEGSDLPKVQLYEGAAPSAEKAEQPAAPAPAAPVAQSSQVWDSKPDASQAGADFGGRFYALQGGMLHTWDFRPDGTFEHFWVPRGMRTSKPNFEAGKYVVSGNFVTLVILRGGRGGERRVGFQRGANGITLDGIMMTPTMP